MQLERLNLVRSGMLAYFGQKMVGNGQGTPRNLGRAKFLITTQQVAMDDRVNS
ncbi:Mycobacterium numidiamassiliense ORFan [Mycobacterium numidiamassiliense]|uniref:Mycobacterium numidiamassiliense ORFan n=1 Tax=Mycobacterium numidiamassiliense TaxID=1841861 RepID=A0A2U3PG76_9MYCO|nr:Mycobacterium numidiamassiliense ORFan [Mycobacterium numidiamassiliense]